VAALLGEVTGQDDAQVFDGQRAELDLGQRGFELFDERADQGSDIETIQGAGGEGDAQRCFAGGDGGVGHDGLQGKVFSGTPVQFSHWLGVRLKTLLRPG